MKKTRVIIRYLMIAYIAWHCFTQFQFADDHLSYLMEIIGVAGEETVKVARGAIK